MTVGLSKRKEQLQLKLVIIVSILAALLMTGSATASGGIFADVNLDGHVDIIDIGHVVAEFGNPDPARLEVQTYRVKGSAPVAQLSFAFCDSGDPVTGGGWSTIIEAPAPEIVKSEPNESSPPSTWIVGTFDSNVRAVGICADNPPLRPENTK